MLCSRRVVLVDEATEHVMAPDVERGVGAVRLTGRHLQVEAPVWTLAVVMVDVLPKYSFEVAPAQHEEVIQAFGSDGSHPALGVGVGPRGAVSC